MSSGEDALVLPPALPPSSNVFFADKWKSMSYNQSYNPTTRVKTVTTTKSDDTTGNHNEISTQQPEKITTGGSGGVTPKEKQKSDKGRESIITNDRGVILKKICSVQECNKIVTVRVDRYLAIKSGKLCKGNMNTKRLFIREDIVDVINPLEGKFDKSCIVSRKQTNGNRVDMYARVLQDYIDCLEFKGKYLQMFRARKEGITKTDNKVCYLIKPIEKNEIWIEDPYSVREVKDSSDDYTFDERSSLEPVETDSESEEEEEEDDDDDDDSINIPKVTIPSVINFNSNFLKSENTNQKVSQNSPNLYYYGVVPIFPIFGRGQLPQNKVLLNDINFGNPTQQNEKQCQLPPLTSILSQPPTQQSTFLSSSASLATLASSSTPPIFPPSMSFSFPLSQNPNHLGNMPPISPSKM